MLIWVATLDARSARLMVDVTEAPSISIDEVPNVTLVIVLGVLLPTRNFPPEAATAVVEFPGYRGYL